MAVGWGHKPLATITGAAEVTMIVLIHPLHMTAFSMFVLLGLWSLHCILPELRAINKKLDRDD